MSSKFTRHPITYFVTASLLLFLVLFPKGGFKLGDTPITWGYLILGLSAVPLVMIRSLEARLSFRPSALLAFGATVPFQAALLYSIAHNGFGGLGIVMSDVSGFSVLPVLFLLVYPEFLSGIDTAWFAKLLRFCIVAAALWGILLFFWYPAFGKLIEIPLLTVNLADYGQLEAQKHIVRGPFLKLISTYNNGNVYGVATLILLPLYRLLEPSRWKRSAVYVALVLTLSRTVWIGMIGDQLMSLAVGLWNSSRDFPRVYPGQAVKRTAALAAIVAVIGVGFAFTINSLSFLLDTSFGGRQGQLAALADPTILPGVPLNAFTEILYLSVLNLFGVSGLLALLLMLFSPVLVLLLRPEFLESESRRAALKGLLLYAFVAASDAAANLIPVLVFYWFAYMTFIYGLPGEQTIGARARLGRAEPASLQPALPAASI